MSWIKEAEEALRRKNGPTLEVEREAKKAAEKIVIDFLYTKAIPLSVPLHKIIEQLLQEGYRANSIDAWGMAESLPKLPDGLIYPPTTHIKDIPLYRNGRTYWKPEPVHCFLRWGAGDTSITLTVAVVEESKQLRLVLAHNKETAHIINPETDIESIVTRIIKDISDEIAEGRYQKTRTIRD